MKLTYIIYEDDVIFFLPHPIYSLSHIVWNVIIKMITLFSYHLEKVEREVAGVFEWSKKDTKGLSVRMPYTNLPERPHSGQILVNSQRLRASFAPLSSLVSL